MTHPALGRDSLAISTASLTSAVSQRRSIDQPTTRPLKASRTTAAVDLSFARRVLSDVGEPQDVGSVDGEVALDQVFFGGLVHQVLAALLRPREAL